MQELAPILRDQRKIDADHPKLIGIFHFVYSGLALAGIGFLLLHYLIFSTVLSNPALFQGQKTPGFNPVELFSVFRWFYLLFGILLITGSVANLISGLFIRNRKNRMYSMVIAGINCIQFPFGTMLGVFTIIVLLRESVQQLYDQK